MEAIRLLSPSSVTDEYESAENPHRGERRLINGTIGRIRYGFASVCKTIFRILPSLSRNRKLHKVHSRRHRGYFCKPVVYAAITIACFIFFSALNALLRPSYSRPPPHYELLRQRVISSTRSGRGNVNNEKVYIAANIINEELIRGTWGQSVLELVDLLGERNVFISIYENDSGAGTQNALLELQQKFACNSSVVTGVHLPLSDFPKMTLPDGQERVQRLTYLAEVRNRLFRPLDPTFALDNTTSFRSAVHISFSKILFLNDVYFSPLDAVQLLFSTNANSVETRTQSDLHRATSADSHSYEQKQTNYRAACAIDFVRAVMFYDSFVVRDTEGYGMGLMFYPFFAPSGSGTSRSDVRRQTDAVRVRSCWGGMAAFDASVFQNHAPEPSSPSSLAVTFRGSNELFWEAAECCLLFADMEVRLGMPDAEKNTGVFINPFIRVAYTQETWEWLPFIRRYERLFEYLQYIVSSIGYPEFNPRRTHEGGVVTQEQVWVPDTRLAGNGSFQLVTREATPGGFCGQRRMFVMKQDLEEANTYGNGKNWEKIKVPNL